MLRDQKSRDDEAGWAVGSGRIDWREVDRNLRRIARHRAALDGEELRWLREAVRGEIWHELGAASLLAYLEHRLGYTPRAAAERVRVAMALGELPEIADALETGELPFTAVRELSRVATSQTEGEWLEHVRGMNVRQIEQAVSGRQRGDLPSDPPRHELVMRTLRFEVRPETLARLRQVQQMLDAEVGARLDDDALVSAMCEAVLAPRGSGGSGKAKHQILTIECARCGDGWQDGAGVRVAIDRTALERAHCDAERIDPATLRAAQDVPPRVRRFVWRRDRGACTVPGCRSARFVELHHIVPRLAGGSHKASNLTSVCGAHHRAIHDGLLAIDGTAPKLVIRWLDDRDRDRKPDDGKSTGGGESARGGEASGEGMSASGGEASGEGMSASGGEASGDGMSASGENTAADSDQSAGSGARPAHVGAPAAASDPTKPKPSGVAMDVTSGLVRMGFKRSKARAAVAVALDGGCQLRYDPLMRAALRQLRL